MVLLVALVDSVYMLLPLSLAFTSPDFLMGRRGETEAVLLFIPCLALFATIIPYHRFHDQSASQTGVHGGRWYHALRIVLGSAAGV